MTPSAVPDVLAPDLGVVFCGINPGRVSDAAAAHFANPRNDFWRLLHAAGFTPRLYEPQEQFALLELGIGVTNAAYRTTPGSGDLRRSDFAGSAERLGRLAAELRPRAIAFVGKEAYRGAFNERPALGLQARTLGETWLYVLPSTSPANAAVPYAERLRWFEELARLLLPVRVGVRALVLDPDDRVLLVRFPRVWATPGGGVESGETEEEALRRELAEECGIRDYELGPCLWTRTHRMTEMEGWGGQTERLHLVRVGRIEPAPDLTPAELLAEGVSELRWWTLDELEAADTLFAPRRLPELVRRLLADGPPDAPFDVGL
jgi:G:T/U-mismatch repair DNA glycosylase/ADP-ribose pyrophosphatase YjhB (NUDIX family)